MNYENYLEYLNSGVEDPSKFLQRFVITVAIIITLLLINKLLSWVLERYVSNQKLVQYLYRWKRVAILILSIGSVLLLWFDRIESLTITISVIVFVAALALRGLILDIVAYIYVSIREPFDIGDRIEINGCIGDVLDIDFLQIHLLEVENIITNQEATGRSIAIPNRLLFEQTTHIYSYKSPFIKQDVTMLISFDSDRDMAFREASRVAYEVHQKILENSSEESVEAFNKSIEIGESSNKPSVRMGVKGAGFEIVVTYFTDYHNMSYNNTRMQLALYDAFLDKNIEMPTAEYHQVEHSNMVVK